MILAFDLDPPNAWERILLTDHWLVWLLAISVTVASLIIGAYCLGFKAGKKTSKPSSAEWSRAEIIGAFGVAVMIVSALLSLLNPEVRSLLGF